MKYIHITDDYVLQGGQRPPSSQQFPLQITSDAEGGTPGVPGVDYPVLSTIPQTKFDCKTQRYKGFFADTEARCQVSTSQINILFRNHKNNLTKGK